jgi:hypothetical protein
MSEPVDITGTDLLTREERRIDDLLDEARECFDEAIACEHSGRRAEWLLKSWETLLLAAELVHQAAMATLREAQDAAGDQAGAGIVGECATQPGDGDACG